MSAATAEPPSAPEGVEALRVGPLRVTSTLDGPGARRAFAALREAYVDVPRATVAEATLVLERYDGPGEVGPATLALDGDASGRYHGRCGRWDARLDLSDPRRARVVGRLPRDMAGEDRVAAMATTLTRLAAAAALVPLGGFLVHGAALVRPGGGAVLFAGPSGAGKTTMTRRLPGWTALADDTVLIEWDAGQGAFYAGGTPFRGHEGLPRTGLRAPLERVAVLAPHAAQGRWSALDEASAFASLMARIIWFVRSGPLVDDLTELVQRCAQTVPFGRLETSLEHDVAALLASAGEGAR